MLNIFKKKRPVGSNLKIDLHSHLLPGIDDGVENFDEALEIIKNFKTLGYSKLITTPHIMQDFYDNTPEIIRKKRDQLREVLKSENIEIEIEAAAEYYLDDFLIASVANPDYEFLTFGNNYLLFETSFMNEPIYINEFVFQAKSRGLNPVMAHPERYAYLQNKPGLIDDLIQRGILMQVNINSFVGYYSKQVKKVAEKMVTENKIHFLGSDCHNITHMTVMKNAIQEKYYQKATKLSILNHSL